MVRFKLILLTFFTSMSSSSQFHYGSIQTMRRWSWAVENSSHNSTMVRFKLTITRNKFGELAGSQFHYGSIQTIDRVQSICDGIQMSQFHYGSIQTGLWWLWFCVKKSHNSTMVRFKQKMECYCNLRIALVTIPLWFDSNRSRLECKEIKSLGHNSTMVRFKLCRAACLNTLPG